MNLIENKFKPTQPPPFKQHFTKRPCKFITVYHFSFVLFLELFLFNVYHVDLRKLNQFACWDGKDRMISHMLKKLILVYDIVWVLPWRPNCYARGTKEPTWVKAILVEVKWACTFYCFCWTRNQTRIEMLTSLLLDSFLKNIHLLTFKAQEKFYY